MRKILRKFIPPFFLSFYHFSLAFLAALFYRFPSRKIFVVGVTGTNGKTTTIEMINAILERAGIKTALSSSLRFKIGSFSEYNKLRMTMPGRFFLQKFLRKAVKEKCQIAILEVTSEGIKQFRHCFIHFSAAILTNLSPEHIEAHGGFENYKKAKGKLFAKTKNLHILNLDDKNVSYFLQFSAKEKYLYSFLSQKEGENGTLIKGENIQEREGEITFSLKGVSFRLPLLGKFNAYNALAALSLSLFLKIPLELASEALASFSGVPGRMEVVINKPFFVIVDYAFTPNALEKVYESIKRNLRPRKIIALLGACGGGRDRWKRPVLGKIASSFAQKVILTNEDPYDEDPWQIIEEVAKGVEKEKTIKILDRRAAVKRALEIAEKGDVVVITGKGAEPSICLAGGKKIPWDDRQVIREEFQKLFSSKNGNG